MHVLGPKLHPRDFCQSFGKDRERGEGRRSCLDLLVFRFTEQQGRSGFDVA
jgi:hypothetical protein